MIVYHVYLPFIILLKVIFAHIGLNPSHYGPLLIPVIAERLPDAIKLLITMKLGKSNSKILELIECIKEEVDARENCEISNEN